MNSPNPTPEPQRDEETPAAREVYAELAALGEIVELLEALDERAQKRAVDYLADRYKAGS